MIASQKDIFISAFRGMSDGELHSFLRLLNLSTSILCKVPVKQVKEILDALLDAEKLYDEDLLTDEQIKTLLPAIGNEELLNTLKRGA